MRSSERVLVGELLNTCHYCPHDCHTLEETGYSIPDTYLVLSGFYKLIESGVVASSLTDFLRTTHAWIELADLIAQDCFAAAAVLSHYLIEEGRFKSILEWSCAYGIQLSLTLKLLAGPIHSYTGISSILSTMNKCFHILDIDTLLVDCPDVILWLVLILGPHASESESPRMLSVLERAKSATNLFDFENAVAHIRSSFIWASDLTPGAMRFFKG